MCHCNKAKITNLLTKGVGGVLKIYSQISILVRYALAGVMMGSGFVWPLCIPISIVGILLCITLLLEPQKKLYLIVGCTFAIFLKSLMVFSWIWSTFPVRVLAEQTLATELGIISMYWLTTALWLSIGGFWMGVCWYVLLWFKISKRTALLIFPFLWLSGELIGALSFSIFSQGQETFSNLSFSFGMAGYIVSSIPAFLYLAPYGGVWVCSVVGVALLCGVVWFYPGFQRKTYLGFSVLIIVVGSFTYGAWQHTGQKPVTIAVVDTQYANLFTETPKEYENRKNQLIEVIKNTIALKPDYILLPEEVGLLKLIQGNSPESSLSLYQKLYDFPAPVLIDSSSHLVNDGSRVVRVSVIHNNSRAIFETDKQYLTPQGEYVPTWHASLFRKLGFADVVNELETNNTYSQGTNNLLNPMPATVPGILFCYESVVPFGVIAQTRRHNLPFIAHPISHVWFNHPWVLWHQLDAMVSLHAAAGQVPIVSAGNMVAGKVYLPNGYITKGKKIYTSETVTVSMVTLD